MAEDSDPNDQHAGDQAASDQGQPHELRSTRCDRITSVCGGGGADESAANKISHARWAILAIGCCVVETVGVVNSIQGTSS